MLITLTDLLSRSVPPGGVSSASICGWRTFPVGEGRTAGLLAHIAEEQHWPIGFLMASHGEAAISYEDGSG